MLSSAEQYAPEMIQRMQVKNMTEEEIAGALEEYLASYNRCRPTVHNGNSCGL
jgi:hypothetical protein